MAEYLIRMRYEEYLRNFDKDKNDKPMSYEDFRLSYEDMINDQ